MQRSIDIAGRTFDLVLPAVPDAFLEALHALPRTEHDKHDVYWSQLWQAAPATAARVLSHNWSRGTAALEFGCGIGLVGLAALAAGLDVTFSDYEPMAVQTALENARLNGFTHPQGKVLDWCSPPPERYPVLLGCDVLYNQQMHEALIDFIDHTLAADGVCWIGDAGRFHAAKFLQLANSSGFSTRLQDEAGHELPHPRHGQFQLFELRRK
jgi:predicted nicotinamide N-methyase